MIRMLFQYAHKYSIWDDNNKNRSCKFLKIADNNYCSLNILPEMNDVNIEKREAVMKLESAVNLLNRMIDFLREFFFHIHRGFSN